MSGPDVIQLNIPDSLRQDEDPVHAALLNYLHRLEDSLQQGPSGQFNYVPVVWAFRDVLDFISVFMASVALVPLSPSEAPLPGWRRSLWRSDFSDVSGGLLSWAVSYLPKRSHQNRLVESILNFLYVSYTRTAGGETRPYTCLLGLGGSSSYGQVPWNIWRSRFFATRKLDDLSRLAANIVNYLPLLNELLPAFANFLDIWHFEIAERRGRSGRLLLNTEVSKDELPPFIVFSKCSLCSSERSMYFLASPCHGSRFLYREVGTGHLTTLEVDSNFRRRFFTSAVNKERTSMTSLAIGEMENDAIPLVTESVEELRTKLLAVLGKEVLYSFHLPLLAASCEAGAVLPLELLRYPGFGIRDGEFSAYRLNGLIAFGEDGGIEPRSPQVVELCHDRCAYLCELANRQLAVWAETALSLQDGEPFTSSTGLAVRNLANWAAKCQDPEFVHRLIAESSFMPTVHSWLQDMVKNGSSDDRKEALRVSDNYIHFLASSSAPTVGEQIVELCLFRSEVFKSMLDYDQAKQELDKACQYVEANERNRLVKAKVLGERARLNLELELPRLAVEDASQAAEIWGHLADMGDLNALNNLARITILRAKAQISMGQRPQAIAALQKTAERKANPRTPEDCMAWASLNLQLAELLNGQSNSRQVRKCFEDVLRFSQGLPETSAVVEARAKALSGLTSDKEQDKSLSNLRQSQVYFETLINEQGRSEFVPQYAEVIYQIAFLLEKVGDLKECLTYTESAIKLFEELEQKGSGFADRVSLAKLWLLRSRIEELNDNYVQAEEIIAKSLKYYSGLIEDSQIRYISDYAKVLAKRGSLRITQGNYEGARQDLETSIERWPGAHDLKNAKIPLARVFLNLGIAYAHSGNIVSALAQFEKGLVISENRGDRNTCYQVLSERVWVLFYDGQFKRAEDDFSSMFSARRGEQSAMEFLGRGATCLYQQKYLAALADFSQVLLDHSGQTSTLALVGAAYSCIEASDWTSAFPYLQKILDAIPSDDPTDLMPIELHQAVWGTMAHLGLARVYEAQGEHEQAVAESVSGCQLWEKYVSGSDDYANFHSPSELFSVYYAYVPQILFQSSMELISKGHVGEVIAPLRSVRNFGAHNEIYRISPDLGFKAGLELVKIFTSLKNGREVFTLTQELANEIADTENLAPGENNSVVSRKAWLYFNMIRLLIGINPSNDGSYKELDYCPLATLADFTDRTIECYETLLASGLGLQERANYAEVMFFKGMLEVYSGQPDEAKKAFNQSKRLYTDLRTQFGGSGYELELSSNLMNLVHIAQDEEDEDQVVFLLDEMLTILSEGKLNNSASLLRESFVRDLTLFIGAHFLEAIGSQDLLGDLMILPLWSQAEIATFENSLSTRLQGQIRRSLLPVLRNLVKKWSERSDPQDTRPGEKILTVWLAQGLEQSARGSREGISLLEQLVDFGEHEINIAHWADHFAVRAQEGLAGFYASEGNNRFATDLLEQALSLIGSMVDADTRLNLQIDLGIKRAELLLKANLYEETKRALESAEAYFQQLKTINTVFKEKIERIRVDLFLRGELTTKEEPHGADKPTEEPAEGPSLAEQLEALSLNSVENRMKKLGGSRQNKASQEVPAQEPEPPKSSSTGVVEQAAKLGVGGLISAVTGRLLGKSPRKNEQAEAVSASPESSLPTAEDMAKLNQALDDKENGGVGPVVQAPPKEDTFDFENELPVRSSAKNSKATSANTSEKQPKGTKASKGDGRPVSSSPAAQATANSEPTEPTRQTGSRRFIPEDITGDIGNLTTAAPPAAPSGTVSRAFDSKDSIREINSRIARKTSRSSSKKTSETDAAQATNPGESAPAEVADKAASRTIAGTTTSLKRSILRSLNGDVAASSEGSQAPHRRKQSPPAETSEEGLSGRADNRESISARLNAKLSQKAKPMSMEPAYRSREDKGRSENEGGKLAASEAARKISLKGAVSDAQLEILTQKAAAHAQEPVKVVPKKVFTVDDSVKERVEQERQRKERAQRRADANKKATAQVEPAQIEPNIDELGLDLPEEELTSEEFLFEDQLSKTESNAVSAETGQPVSTGEDAIVAATQPTAVSEPTPTVSRPVSLRSKAAPQASILTAALTSSVPTQSDLEPQPEAFPESTPLSEASTPADSQDSTPSAPPVANVVSVDDTAAALPRNKKASLASLRSALLKKRADEAKGTAGASSQEAQPEGGSLPTSPAKRPTVPSSPRPTAPASIPANLSDASAKSTIPDPATSAEISTEEPVVTAAAQLPAAVGVSTSASTPLSEASPTTPTTQPKSMSANHPSAPAPAAGSGPQTEATPAAAKPAGSGRSSLRQALLAGKSGRKPSPAKPKKNSEAEIPEKSTQAPSASMGANSETEAQVAPSMSSLAKLATGILGNNKHTPPIAATILPEEQKTDESPSGSISVPLKTIDGGVVSVKLRMPGATAKPPTAPIKIPAPAPKHTEKPTSRTPETKERAAKPLVLESEAQAAQAEASAKLLSGAAFQPPSAFKVTGMRSAQRDNSRVPNEQPTKASPTTKAGRRPGSSTKLPGVASAPKVATPRKPVSLKSSEPAQKVKSATPAAVQTPDSLNTPVVIQEQALSAAHVVFQPSAPQSVSVPVKPSPAGAVAPIQGQPQVFQSPAAKSSDSLGMVVSGPVPNTPNASASVAPSNSVNAPVSKAANAPVLNSDTEFQGVAIKGTLSVKSMLRSLGVAVAGKPRKDRGSQLAAAANSTATPTPQPPASSGNGVLEASAALQEIDTGFSYIDAQKFESAWECFRHVGDEMKYIEAEQRGEVMAACLEGLNNLGYAMAEQGVNEQVLAVSNYAVGLSHKYLADRYDSAAWPWWGDIERQAGEFNGYACQYGMALEHLRKAIEIYLKLIDLGVGEASRVDALNTYLSMGKVCEDMKSPEQAVQVYGEAIEQGSIALANGFAAEMTMAEINRRLAEIYMLSGYCELAYDNFSWALEYYARDSEKTGNHHFVEAAAVRLRLAESCFVLEKTDDAYASRNEMLQALEYLQKYQRKPEADILARYLKEFDDLALKYMNTPHG